jgi:hypothetical protein
MKQYKQISPDDQAISSIAQSIARIEAELAWFAEYKEFVAFMQAEYAKACGEAALVSEVEAEQVRK